MPLKRNEKRDRAIILLYRAGTSLAACGRAFGLSAERVRAILIAHGVERRSVASNQRRRRLKNLVVAAAFAFGLGVVPPVHAESGDGAAAPCATFTSTAIPKDRAELELFLTPRTLLERILDRAARCERKGKIDEREQKEKAQADLRACEKENTSKTSTAVRAIAAVAAPEPPKRQGLSTVEWVVVIGVAVAIISAIGGYALARETEPEIPRR